MEVSISRAGLARIELLDLLRRTGVGFLVELDDVDFQQLRIWG